MENDDALDLDALPGTEAYPLSSIWKVSPIESKEGRLRIGDCIRHAIENGYL